MFNISTKLDYGLILLRSLAERPDNRPVSLRAIARQNNLPYHYLSQIALPLKAAGILQGFEGARGGYLLGRKPSDITLKEISALLVSVKKDKACHLDADGVCKRKNGCSVSPWWGQFNRRFQKMLNETTVADLV